jgi:cholesterol transport system auxiliary component
MKRLLVARPVILLGIGLLASACSGFRSGETATVTYNLRATAAPATADAPAAPSRLKAFSLQVMAPVAGPGLDSDAILLTAPDHRLEHFAASKWAATAPKMLASLAAETLRNRGLLAAVHDDVSPFPGDYLLRMTIRRFDADYAAGAGAAPAATVVLDCVVGTRVDRKLLANFVAQATVRADGNRMGAVVAAFEQATQDAMGKLAEQALAVMSAEAAAN